MANVVAESGETIRDLGPTANWPARHLLRWEATDLYAYVLETQSLSTIRGASVLLELFCEHVPEILAGEGLNRACYRIVQARAGQVRLIAKDEDAAIRIAGVLTARARRDPFRLASGAAWVALTTSADGVANWRDLSAQIVAQRMMQLDVDPGEYPDNVAPDVDPVDRVRLVAADALPTHTRTAPDGSSMRLGVRTRGAFHVGQQYRFGLAEQLYERWCTREQGREYQRPRLTLSQWEQIAIQQPGPRDPRPFRGSDRFLQDFQALGQHSNLPGTIAVIETDGNGFGKWMAQFTDPQDVQRASDALHCAIQDALVDAIAPELSDMHDALGRRPGGADHAEDAVQLAQLLLLAGDELVLVVPGHRGLQVAESFLNAWPEAARAAWPHDDTLASLTFGLGLVVSHATTPIQHLRQAAHDLLESAKKAAKEWAKQQPAGTPPQSFVDWALLKSHDVPPDGVMAERQRVLSGVGGRRMKRPARSLSDLLDLHQLAHHLLDQGFPQRQLERRLAWLAGAWSGGAAWSDRPKWSDEAKAIIDGLEGSWPTHVKDKEDHALVELRELLDIAAVEDTRLSAWDGGAP